MPRAIGEVLAGLAADRTRILVVALGVTWGTLGLTLLLATGVAMHAATDETIEVGGADLLRFWSGTTSRPHAGLPAGRRISFEVDDAELVRAAVPELRAASLEYQAGSVQARVAGRAPTNLRVHGVGSEFSRLRGFVPEPDPEHGRVLNERDVREHRRVAFVGRTVLRRLFGDVPIEDVVGSRFELRGQAFTVVGVRDARPPLGNYSGRDEDKLLIPETTWRDLFGARSAVYLIAGLHGRELAEAAKARVRAVLGARRGFDAEDTDALGCVDKTVIDAEVRGITVGVLALTGIVGVLGLLVALVGVGNAMFVMVDERRREFALLVALGARPATILRQRIVEALAITLLGGAAGIAVAGMLLFGIRQIPIGDEGRAYLGYPELSWSVALGTAVALGVAGGLAGYWPARRAAAVDPVEVLRDE